MITGRSWKAVSLVNVWEGSNPLSNQCTKYLYSFSDTESIFSVCNKWSEVLSFLIIAVWWGGHNFDCSFTYWILQFSIRNSLPVAGSKFFVKFCFSILYNVSLSLSYCVKCFKIDFLCFNSVSLCFECSGWWWPLRAALTSPVFTLDK